MTAPAVGSFVLVETSVAGFHTPGSFLAGKVVKILQESLPGFVFVIEQGDDKNKKEFMIPASWVTPVLDEIEK